MKNVIIGGIPLIANINIHIDNLFIGLLFNIIWLTYIMFILTILFKKVANMIE